MEIEFESPLSVSASGHYEHRIFISKTLYESKDAPFYGLIPKLFEGMFYKIEKIISSNTD